MDRIKDRSCDWHYKMMENILGVVFEKVGEDEYFVEKKEVKAQKFDFDENGDIFQELPLENDLPHIEAPLYSVRQFTLDGITYQVMLVKDTYTTYKNFPTSLSKFVLHGSTIKELSEEELTTTKLRNFINVSDWEYLCKGVCLFKEGSKQKYMDKMVERFGGLVFHKYGWEKKHPEKRVALFRRDLDKDVELFLNKAIPFEGNI